MKPQFNNEKYLVMDLFELLEYVDEKVNGFKDLMWEDLCEYTNVANDIMMKIDFSEYGDNENETMRQGLDIIVNEFPEVLTHNIIYDICW